MTYSLFVFQWGCLSNCITSRSKAWPEGRRCRVDTGLFQSFDSVHPVVMAGEHREFPEEFFTLTHFVRRELVPLVSAAEVRLFLARRLRRDFLRHRIDSIMAP